MTPLAVYASLRVVGYVVILSMAGSLVFTGYVALVHWAGIGV